MKLLRLLLDRGSRPTVSRFDRYYGEIVRSGVGYPTADEARRDLSTNPANVAPYTAWLR